VRGRGESGRGRAAGRGREKVSGRCNFYARFPKGTQRLVKGQGVKKKIRFSPPGFSETGQKEPQAKYSKVETRGGGVANVLS